MIANYALPAVDVIKFVLQLAMLNEASVLPGAAVLATTAVHSTVSSHTADKCEIFGVLCKVAEAVMPTLVLRCCVRIYKSIRGIELVSWSSFGADTLRRR